MNAAERYLETAAAAVDRLRGQHEPIERAAQLLAASVGQGGVLHVAGSGHSQLVALELAVRAGGLAAVQAIADPALGPGAGSLAAHLERLPGYAAAVLDASDCRPGEVLAVVSNSGINPVPVELALEGRERGLHVVAVTSLAHAAVVGSRHPDGLRLHELAAVVIDTGAPPGDTALQVAGIGVGPLSTQLGIAVLHAVACRAVEVLAAQGSPAPVLISQNLAHGPDVNAALLARYRDRGRWTR